MTEQLARLRIDIGEAEPVEMLYREGTKDRHTLEENWVKHPYRLSRYGDQARRAFIDETYARLTEAGATPLIIDAGANIGASVLFFSWRYPLAKIIGIEPESSNFELLRKNTAGRPNIGLTRSALASTDGTMNLYDPGRSTDAFRALPPGSNAAHGEVIATVPALSVATMLKILGQNTSPMLAKIDIEGGEAELFSANTDWVDAFPAIAIELHDWMLPGQASSASFLRCVGERGRDFINPVHSDVVFSLRNPN
jgi:FkbM family methyltransferase